MSIRSDQGTVHQRTLLFGSKPNNPTERASSPYNSSSIDYSQSTLAQLESQSDGHVNIMRDKVKALKDLSLKMGEEIRGSSNTIEGLENTFEQTRTKLKRTFNRMMIMAKNSTISFKTWLLIILAVFLLFGYVWIF
ncbi:HDL008Cp [Eremothecium sinecaudum]|uniref:HDL008Cp n=1 Tax=Eremothecium sinecaudum TaxID=45286 RepID=A0A0X8HSP2_9SACH|nr:HDL008Cp [Eremothecium sinecaudum]AMD20736.1 HDL008Cp [Eremothecium sinecaudum]